MKYVSILAKVTNDKASQSQRSAEQDYDEPEWPKELTDAATLVKDVGRGVPRDVLTHIECQILQGIFEVLVESAPECVLKLTDRCISKKISVFRRHAGAMNYYSLGVLLQRITGSAPLSEFMLPKIYRYSSEHEGLVCWRCGNF